MTTSFVVGYDPIWYNSDIVGQAASGAQLFTYSSLTPNLPKATYYDSGGNFPQPNPIVADLNGTFGPIYFSVNSSNTLDNYYLVLLDKNDNLLWSFNNYSPGSGGGGGGSTNYINTVNYISNNIMLNNIGTTNLSGVLSKVIAPSNHQGVFYNQSATNGSVGPDMIFYKNVGTATDSISFPTFAAGLNPLAPDVTPPFYAEYVSTGTTGELQKYFQWLICPGVKNLVGQQMTFTCCVQSGTSTTTNIIKFNFRQYFGSGGSPSADVNTTSGNFTIGVGWQKLTFTINVPTISGSTPGDCGDDATYIQIIMPQNTSCDVCFTKPYLILGMVAPDITFDTYDQIDSIVQGFRTGDVRTSINSFQPYGWVPANNGTIGSSTSNANNRANVDTFPLFATIWTAMSANQQYAPMYTSSGTPVAYGASAIADFSANNQLSLTRSLGQVFAGTSSANPPIETFTVNTGASNFNLNLANALQYGTGTPVMLSVSGGALPTGLNNTDIYFTIYISSGVIQLASTIAHAFVPIPVEFTTNGSGTFSIAIYGPSIGTMIGENLHILTSGELPNPLTTGSAVGSGTGGSNSFIESNSAAGSGTISNSGGGLGHNTVQPTTFMNVFFKL